MRVYLSKSNLACPYLVDMVRQIIQKEGYLTIEFFGDKEYSEKDLLFSDVLVVIPAKEILSKTIGGVKSIDNTPPDVDWGYHLGRGQFQQITSFMTRNRRMYNIKGMSYIACQDPTIICLEEVGETEVYCGSADSLKEFPGGDWKVRYGKLEINSYLDNLKTSLHQAARSGQRYSSYAAQNGIVDVSVGIGKTFVPKSYGNGGITVPGYHGYDPQRGVYPLPGYEKEIANMAKDLSIPSNRTEEAFMKNADGTITLPKQESKIVWSETKVVPHLACRMLYNL